MSLLWSKRAAGTSFLDTWRSECSPKNLPAVVSAAVVIALSAIVSGIGVAALIFTGPLQPFLFSGIGVVLFGAAVMLAVLSLCSSYPGSICLPQEVPAVILGLLGTSLYTALTPAMAPDAAIVVVMAAIAAATMITGAVFLLLGVLRLGDVIRFIPYPLVGGVLAGLGWLLLQGGVTVLVGAPLTLDGLPELVVADQLLRLGSGLLLGIVLLLTTARSNHFAVIPGVLAAGVAIFYLLVWGFGSTAEAAENAGWLLGPFPEQAGWTAPNWKALALLDGSLIIESLPIIATLVLASTISILLYASGLELGVRRDMDLNHELRGCGLANLCAGGGGGVPGFHSMGDSLLAHAMGAPFRLTGLLAAVLVAVGLFAGFTVLAWFPRPVLGGLLLFLGLSLLLTWVVQGYRRLPLGDWCVVMLILGVAGWFGFLVGIGVGLVAGIILFTLNYSRIPVAKHELSGAEWHSNVDRSADERHLIEQRGRSVHVLALQGFIFFGTANKVLERVLRRLADDAQPPLTHLLLDFARVSGLDTSSVTTFRKLDQLAEGQRFEIILTGLAPGDLEMLVDSELDLDNNANLRVESDLDHGLEYCEQALLGSADQGDEAVTLAEALPGLPEAERIASYAQQVSFGVGEVLIRQGEPSNHLFIILEGRVTVRLEGREDDPRRLRSYGPGTLVGEMAMYMGTPRSASVVAESPTRGLRLSRPAIDRMTVAEPRLAASLHSAIAKLLAERLARNNELLGQLA